MTKSVRVPVSGFKVSEHRTQGSDKADVAMTFHVDPGKLRLRKGQLDVQQQDESSLSPLLQNPSAELT